MKSNQKKTKRISRRAFVRGAGAGSAALAGASVLSASPAQAQERDSSAIPEQWDLEADCVVTPITTPVGTPS